MALINDGRTWDDASSPAAAQRARLYEAAWKANPSDPPDLRAFLPDGPDLHSGMLLALLRADLNLRRESGEAVRVESYRERYRDLPADVLVALIYEEFCLREEAGEAPAAADYEARFPDVAHLLREVLDIHALVGSTHSLFSPAPEPGAGAFPEVGRSIAGFRLLEELGRGAFGRVYLAQERPLADRRVALKVTRAGSQEPQALARLQHTHIVPVYSYRHDAATGLHLLCMPFFSGVTLAHLLAARAELPMTRGADLLAALDGLRRGDEDLSPRAEGRAVLQRLSFPRAVAWWGARLAEALQHAHEQGILHRDLKPSNILITPGAMPMLLDFNLSQCSTGGAEGGGSEGLGGTLAYMAPEHLEAVFGHGRGGIDARADIYALGVVLFETLAFRPFAASPDRRMGSDVLLAMIEERRSAAPEAVLAGCRVPPELSAVLRRCLAAEPSGRYASAAELAADLQAVADDGPLPVAREPQPARSLRLLRRNRRFVAVCLVSAVATACGTAALLRAQAAALRRDASARRYFAEGMQSFREGQFTAASAQFATAAEWSEGRASLGVLHREARQLGLEAVARARVNERADEFFRKVEPLRFRLIAQKGLREVSREMERALGPFGVLEPGPLPWTRSAELDRLAPAKRARLVDEVNELLFLWVVASDRPDDPERAARSRAACDLALRFAEPAGPWRALRARYESPTRAAVDRVRTAPRPSSERSARASFQWALLETLERRIEPAVGWLERAVALRPDDYWYQFAAGYLWSRLDQVDRALSHYDAAVALRKDAPWALFNRAQLYWSQRGAWERARDDLGRLERSPSGIDPGLIDLELGQIAQRLGDFPGALRRYAGLVASGANGDLGLRARLGRAKIHGERGDIGAALEDYLRILSVRPDDVEATLGIAVLSLRRGRASDAEAQLSALLERSDVSRSRAELLAVRALARLVRGNLQGAEADAHEVLEDGRSPTRRRLWLRVALASGRDRELRGARPEDLDRLPARGPGLRRDLRASIRRLAVEAEAGDPAEALAARLTRAVLLDALGRDAEALEEADAAVGSSPLATRPRLIRAQLRERSGDRSGAMEDVEQVLSMAPDEPAFREMRGRLHLELGEANEGLTELDRLGGLPLSPWTRAAKARALRDEGRPAEAIAEWTSALADDPEDAEAFLGRACCFLPLDRWDQALADLERAADWSGDRPRRLARIAGVYAACLPARPNRLPRVLRLLRRAEEAALRDTWWAWAERQGE